MLGTFLRIRLAPTFLDIAVQLGHANLSGHLRGAAAADIFKA
jgi:hypothetical protein